MTDNQLPGPFAPPSVPGQPQPGVGTGQVPEYPQGGNQLYPVPGPQPGYPQPGRQLPAPHGAYQPTQWRTGLLVGGIVLTVIGGLAILGQLGLAANGGATTASGSGPGYAVGRLVGFLVFSVGPLVGGITMIRRSRRGPGVSHLPSAAGLVPGGPGPGVPGYQGAGAPYPYGHRPGPASGRGSRRLVVGLVGGGVVLALVVAVVAALAVRDRASQKADRSVAAVSLVENYLAAVADADADAVLRLLPDYLDEHGSTALISDEVLAVSAQAAPLTDVQVELVSVTEGEYYPKAVVRATYRLGGDQAEQTFDLSGSPGRSGDAQWALLGSTATYDAPAPLEGIEVAVNGQVVPSGEEQVHLVVPGAYQVTATSPYYRLDQSDLRLTDVASSPWWDIVPALSEEGVQAFRTAVRGAVDGCLASKNLGAGCGLDVEATMSNGTVDDGTLTRTLTPEAEAALATLEPTLRTGNPSVATCGTIGGVTTTAQGTIDGRRGTIEITRGFAGLGGTPISLRNPSVTMTDPALSVTW